VKVNTHSQCVVVDDQIINKNIFSNLLNCP